MVERDRQELSAVRHRAGARHPALVTAVLIVAAARELAVPMRLPDARRSNRWIARDGVRYAIFHMNGDNSENRRDVLARLQEFERDVRPLYADDRTRLYEIVGFPP